MATNLITQITKLAERAATEDKAIRALTVAANTKIGELSTLSYGTKTSLVSALNELKVLVDAIDTSGEAIAEINDAAALTATDKTWSISKIDAQIKAAIAAVVGGAPEQLDTLKELSTALNDKADFAAQLVTQMAAKANVADVYAKTETFTQAEVTSAITAATAGLATTASVTAAQTAANNAQADVDALELAIGTSGTSDDFFVVAFDNILNPSNPA